MAMKREKMIHIDAKLHTRCNVPFKKNYLIFINHNLAFSFLTQGKTPLLSLEALHQLHIFIFVLAVTHVIFCATTMVLAGAKVMYSVFL